MQTLAQRLTEDMERHGSLRGAARAMGVAPGTYEGWQKGWRRPRSVIEYEKIEATLGINRAMTLLMVGLLTEEQAEKLSATRPYVKTRQREFALVTAS